MEPEELFDSRDEALAHAVKTSEPGDIISVHDADCDIDNCQCEPLEFICGGAA